MAMYLAPQNIKQVLMAMQTILLNALYDSGDKLGGVLSWIFILLMLIEIVYVFLKYVITSNK